MLMHALFYGTSAPGKMGRYQLFLYLAAQSFLTLITSFLSMYISVLVGLYVALTVEIASCLAPHREKDDHFWIWARRGVVSVIIVTSLFAVNDGLSTVWVFLASLLKLSPRLHEPFSPLAFFAWRLFLIGLSEVVPFLLFVAGYAVLFLRQARTQERARILLDELEAAHAQVTHYATRVETLTRSAERQRMARELHDTLAQGLIGLTMQLETVDLHLTHQRSERAQEVVRHAMTRTRELMIVALHDHVLRALREGLTNVARHAQAHHIWIGVTECAGWLEMEVRDDGIGFDVEFALSLPMTTRWSARGCA
jgi:NarL family two-component system sensor histidine kinase YdfH